MIKPKISKPYDLEDRTLDFAKSVRLFVKDAGKKLFNIDDLKQLTFGQSVGLH